jgi:hypothetical protein
MFQPFFWHDADWYEFHQESQIGIYSREGALEALLDVPCPALQSATRDEAGNLYFTGMSDTIPYQLLEEGNSLERCVARIDAGEREVAEGWPRRFEELTDGRPTGNPQVPPSLPSLGARRYSIGARSSSGSASEGGGIGRRHSGVAHCRVKCARALESGQAREPLRNVGPRRSTVPTQTRPSGCP